MADGAHLYAARPGGWAMPKIDVSDIKFPDERSAGGVDIGNIVPYHALMPATPARRNEETTT